MNKKKVIIIVSVSTILIVVLVLAGLFFGGYMATILPQVNDEAIEEANKKEQENRFAEKEQFAREHGNQVTSSQEEYEAISIQSLNGDSQFREEAIAQENFLNKISNIMTRYYANYNEIAEQKEEENTGMQRIDVEEGLSQTDITFYDMILTVLEKEDLSQDERDTLMELVEGLKSEIEKDASLKVRVENILQE